VTRDDVNNNNNNNNTKHFNICKEIEVRVKIDNKHWYDHVPKSVETMMKVRLPYYGTNKCELTVLLLTINRTS
jgi:hypothetical protein